VRFLKLFLRGLKDTYDQFVMVMVVSVLWWICALLIVPGPPATIALFRMMDPRNQGAMPEVREFFATLRERFATAWGIAVFTVPVNLVLLWNMLFFQGGESFFTLMVPLWFVMIVIITTLMLFAFATAAAMESGVRNAFRGATYLLVMWPFSSVLAIVLLAVISSIFAVLILPLVLFGPGMSAAVINRFVFAGYGVEVIDPNAPTQERRTEVARGINPDQGWLQRLRGGGSRGGRK
jgi:uncharacterized membrane protein YesL